MPYKAFFARFSTLTRSSLDRISAKTALIWADCSERWFHSDLKKNARFVFFMYENDKPFNHTDSLLNIYIKIYIILK